MTLPMIILPRPAHGSGRATAAPSAQGGAGAVPGAAAGATGFAEMLGAAVLDEAGTAAPQPSPQSSQATPADEAAVEPPGEETVSLADTAPSPALTEQAEHVDRDEGERTGPAEAGGDPPAAPLPTPAEVAPADVVPGLAATAAAGPQATSAAVTTTDHMTGDRLGNDDDLPLTGPLAVRPSTLPDVQTRSTTAPAIDTDAAVDNTEPWAFAVADSAAGGSDRPTGPTLTLAEVPTAPTGSAAGATLDSFPTHASAAEPGSTADVVDVTAVAEAVDLTDTALRELQRGELQRIGSSRLGIDVTTTTLGNIRIEALERGGELQLRLGADQPGARLLLTERLPELREHLRAAGVDVGNVDVSSGHDRTRGDRERQSAPSNLAPADTDRAAGDPAPGSAVRALNTSVMSAAGRVDVRI